MLSSYLGRYFLYFMNISFFILMDILMEILVLYNKGRFIFHIYGKIFRLKFD